MMKNNKLINLFLIIVFAWLFILTLEKSLPQEKKTVIEQEIVGISTDLTKICKERDGSVATLLNDGNIASAFFYRKDNNKSYFITSYHAIGDNNTLVFDSGYKVNVDLYSYDPFTDLAILETELPFEIDPIPFGDASLLDKGEFLLAYGSPLSLEYANSVSLALVSSPLRTINNHITFDDNNFSYYQSLIQLSTSLLPGYSGGPLFNMAGELVGMIIFQNRNENSLCFALTSNEIKICADTLIASKSFNHTLIGLKADFITNLRSYERAALDIPLDLHYGLYINDIKDNSIADLAKLKKGDILLSVNGIKIEEFDDYLSLAYEKIEYYRFEVLRDGKHLDLTLEVN